MSHDKRLVRSIFTLVDQWLNLESGMEVVYLRFVSDSLEIESEMHRRVVKRDLEDEWAGR